MQNLSQFTEQFAEVAPRLQAFARRLLADSDRADLLYARTVIRVFRDRHGWLSEERLAHWCLRIMRQLHRDPAMG